MENLRVNTPADSELDPFALALEDLKRRDQLRSLTAIDGLPGKYIFRSGKRCLNLSSNNYLGLAHHPEVKRGAVDAVSRYGAGSGGSRLLGGDSPLHRELEAAVTHMRPLGKSLLFNTGFMANLGVLQALAPVVGPIFSDKLNHASVAEGLKQNSTSFHRYRHRDVTHLESLLATHLVEKGKSALPGLVCSETLFSMDGDFAPLRKILDLQKRFGFYLYLDEAHSTGCYPDLLTEALRQGRENRNSDKTSKQGIDGRLLIMGTFGKAYGGFGAYVAGPESMIDYLVNTARTFIFSTALPPATLGAALAALRVSAAETWRNEKIRENAETARALFQRHGLNTGASESHILPVIIGSNIDAIRFSDLLFTLGFHTPPVRHPTVPEGQARLRINLTSDLDASEIIALAEALAKARDQVDANG